MAISKNSTISFKAGRQKAYDALTSRQESAFYVTTDTHRLYLGNDLLSQSIVAVNALADLPAPSTDLPKESLKGQFYYVESKNILATYNGTEWVQINPDTDTDTSIKALKVSKAVDNATGIKLSFEITQQDINGDEVAAKKKTAEITLAPEDLAAVTAHIALDVDVSVANNVATVGLVGEGLAEDANGFKVTAGDNVTISKGAAEDGFTISAKDTQYKMSSPAGATNIQLEGLAPNADAAKSTISITAGEGLSASGAKANEIQITHDDSGVGAGSYGAAARATPGYGESFNIPSVTVDRKGHVTAAKNVAITLPDMATLEGKNVVANANGDLSVSVDYNGDVVTSTGSGILYNTITVDGKEQKVFNQGSLGSFYSKDTVDAKFLAVDAMRYKGTVSSADELKAKEATASIGDTYKVDADFGAYRKGDILIANGTEGASGVITGIVTWDHIESGEADTTYTFKLDNNTLYTRANTADSDSKFVEIASGDGLAGSGLSVSTDATKKQIKVSHIATTDTVVEGGANAKTTFENAAVIKVPHIKKDKFGHVISIEDIEITAAAEKYLRGDTAQKTVTLVDNNTDRTAHGSIAVKDEANNPVSVVLTTSADQKTNTFKVTHDTITQSDTRASDATKASVGLDGSSYIDAVVGVTRDAFGHVTGITSKRHQIARQDQYTSKHELKAGTGNAAVFTDSVTKNGTDSVGTGTRTVKSDNLTIGVTGTAANATATINFCWDTF